MKGPEAKCLYCDTVTGYSDKPGRKTVCAKCQYRSFRDEAREVATGMRAWARPLSFWVHFFSMKPMPDADAKLVQDAWEAEQAQIREFNQQHAGGF